MKKIEISESHGIEDNLEKGSKETPDFSTNGN